MNNTVFTYNAIMEMEQRYRATLINSAGGFKSLALVGTRNKQGQSNLAIFNSFFHVGAHPPLFGFIIRPDSVERHTLSNILETAEFTVNHIHAGIYEQAHHTAARYPQEVSEFNAAELTELHVNGFYAPFVAESKVRIGAGFVRRVDISENGTCMIIGRIKHISVPGECLQPDGFIDLEKAGSLTGSGLDSYHTTQSLGRLPYAKPGVMAGVLVK